MLVQRFEYLDKPNEVVIYLTQSQLATIDNALVERGRQQLTDSDEAVQRAYCKSLLQLLCTERPLRHVAGIGSDTLVDSDVVGVDAARSAFSPPDDDAFDPNYRAVDVSIRLFDAEGERAANDFIDPRMEIHMANMSRAMQAARVVVACSLVPPSYA
ncbi:MAG TPA: hypothetical protein VLF91_06645 [Candidatus Saccharimonadales bacterium]|nr:hypothetical protein [Candidatus Saccharimonadales bacterium]